MSDLRAGIIGGGWIARVHVPAIDAAPGVTLVAACDVDLARARAITDGRRATAYADAAEMLAREQLDLVWVCTPPLFHREAVEDALARGIHVYLEKPIARDLVDADAIVAAAHASRAVCAVGYQWHASELLADARAALGGRTPGMLVGRNFGPVEGRPWFMDPKLGGGQILERGSHHVDLQRALAGEIVAVEATAGGVDLARAEGPKGIADAISLTFHFASGAIGSVHIAWTAPGTPGRFAVDVLAEDVSLVLELGGPLSLHGSAGGRDVSSERGDPVGRSIARFLDAARAGDPAAVACTPQDARATLAVALACERALESGAREPV